MLLTVEMKGESKSAREMRDERRESQDEELKKCVIGNLGSDWVGGLQNCP